MQQVPAGLPELAVARLSAATPEAPTGGAVCAELVRGPASGDAAVQSQLQPQAQLHVRPTRSQEANAAAPAGASAAAVAAASGVAVAAAAARAAAEAPESHCVAKDFSKQRPGLLPPTPARLPFARCVGGCIRTKRWMVTRA